MKSNILKYTDDIIKPYRDDSPVFFLVGTPYHSNIGDRAIAHATINFISKLSGNSKIIEVPFGSNIEDVDIHPYDTIILQGGGNFGDIWIEEEEYRRRVICSYPEVKTILMPQTIFFKDPEQLKKSVDIYSKSKDLTLVAREHTSLDIMRSNFSKNRIMFAPDIVLSLNYQNLFTDRRKREYALFVVRNDIEKVVPDSYIYRAADILKYELDINNFIYSDMHSDNRETMINSHKFIAEYKLNQFKSAKIVITDRLHGMVFAAITGTPCVVFGSMTYKTTGIYKLLASTKAAEFIRFCDDIEKLSEIINSLNLQKRYTGDIKEFKSFWGELARVIR